MAIQFYNTSFDHSSDATFRAWGSALSTAIQAAGIASGTHPGKLAITTDTGQINWTTVTRPAVNTVAGFEMYKFTDSNAAGSPCFIKIEYGTGTTAAIPQIWVTIGTSSNGSGTLNGFVGTRAIVSRQTTMVSTVTAYPTYVHSSEDCPLNVAWKLGSGTSAVGMMYFSVGRPCNPDGTVRSDALILTFSAATNNGLNVLRVADGAKFETTGGEFGFVPGIVATTAVGGVFTAFQCQVGYPQPYGVNYYATVFNSEIALNTQDSATLYGATSHNYVSLGTAVPNWSTQGLAAHACFMLYEA